MLTYRAATPDDLVACADFEWTRSHDDLAWHVAAELIYVATDGELVVGYARLESFWRTMPYLALIVIREDRRGRGIGSGLLEYICARLRDRGYRSVLSSTTEGERAPHDWHLRNGFVDVGCLRALNQDKLDEVFLRRTLS